MCVQRVPTAGEEAVGFQFCRKANIVARPSESKILLLSRDAYCAVRKVKRIQNEMVKDKPKHVRRGCISPKFLAGRLSRLRVIKLPGPSELPETHPNTI